MNIELSHESFDQLLPWYANGTLSPEEHAAVEQHLEGCARCRSELQWLRDVGTAFNDIADEAPSVQPSITKALGAVESWERSKSNNRFGWISEWFGALWHSSTPVVRYAMAAQFAVIVGLGLFAWHLHREANPAYATLSGLETSTARGVKLTVSFASDATVEEVRRVLGDAGGNIVNGPSANGIYIVQLPLSPDKDQEIESVIQKMRQNKSIRFVERLP